MREPRDECREVALPSGVTIRLRSGQPPDAADLAALDEVVVAAQRFHETRHHEAPDAAALWARIDTVRRAAGLSLRDVSGQCGVPFRVLFRLAQGVMCGPGEHAAIETWLAASAGHKANEKEY